MISVERTTNYGLLDKIFRNPRVYRRISDDSSPSIDAFTTPQNANVMYLIARDGDRPMGAFVFSPYNGCCVDSHVCLLPGNPYRKSLEAGELAIKWIWANTVYRKIVGAIPSDNPHAVRYAEDCGMACYGINKEAFKRNGNYLDLIMLGISRPI